MPDPGFPTPGSDGLEPLEPTEGLEADPSITMTFARGSDLPTERESVLVPALSTEELAGPTPIRLGRYQVRDQLGQGGFGKVFVAYDDQLDRQVAIKVPLRRLSESGINSFLQEARRLARLKHPGIVTVHDVGVQDQHCFIVSDLLSGTSLRSWLVDHRPTFEESARIVGAIAEALDHAHGLGTIHRDVKPANIILDDLLRPVLIDFGLALTETESPRAASLVVGTPAYMSPEQARGEGHLVDGRTDLYSLGVILYVMLCGRRPFRSSVVGELLRQVREDDPQPPRQVRPSIPRELERVCLKAMAKQVADRYATAREFADELRQAIRSEEKTSSILEPVVVEDPGSDLSRIIEGEAPSIERRSVTILNCGCDLEDIETSLSMLEPEQEHQLLVEFRQCCREAVVRRGGLVAVSTAQGLQACFGHPIAHDDAPRRAIEAAVAIADQMSELNQRLRATQGVELSPWSVIHTGLTVVGELETGEGLSIVGEAPTLATRLEAFIEPGWILITEASRQLVLDVFATEPLGTRTIRGIPRPVEVHRINPRSPTTGPKPETRLEGLSPLTGRDLEVNLLKDRWEHAKDESAQLVHLTGEAGIGKSRLVQVLKEFVADDEAGRSATILEWRCSPRFQDSGLYPAIDGLERILRVQPGDPARSRFEKLSGHLQVLGLADPGRLALLAILLSIPAEGLYDPPTDSPQRQREKTLETLIDWLDAQSARRPVLFIVEDLHWVDPTTLELLGMLVEQRPGERIMTVLTSRPEFVPPWPAGSGQVSLAINRLTRRQIAELVRWKVGLKDVPAEIVEHLATRTEGVPLFIEEFARMLEEEGHFQIRDGERALTGSFAVDTIPATLHDLLLSRLDRMPEVKDLAQQGATLGREFSMEMIRAVSKLPETDLRAGLTRLVRSEILFEKGRASRTTFQFKHALIQDAAYQSMTRATRQEVHHEIARAIEASFPELVRSRPELLGHHFSAAGQSEPAITYWLEAVRRSQARSAHAEAIAHITRGLQEVETLPESPSRDQAELSFQVPLAVSLLAARGYAVPELESVHARSRVLSERVGAPGSLFHVVWGMWALRLLRDEMDTAIDLAGQLLGLAKEQGQPGLTMEAWFSTAITRFYRGDFLGTLEACGHCEELEDPEACQANARDMGQDTGMSYRCYRALASWYLGEPDDALDQIDQAVEYARNANHSFSLAYALHHAGWVSYLLRRGDDGVRFGAECLELSNDQGFPFWKALGVMNQGTGHMVAGRLPEALGAVQEAMGFYLGTGSRKSLAEYHGFLAEIHHRAGRLEPALLEVEEALAIADRTNSRCQEAELHRIKGEILLARGPDHPALAESCFLKAIEVARSQSARSWELRSALSLGRLRHRMGQTSEAHETLSSVYQRFRQGHETADLVEARTLIQLWSAG